MEFRDCNQATTSGARKGTADREERGRCGGPSFPHLNFHAKGNELPSMAPRNRRDARR